MKTRKEIEKMLGSYKSYLEDSERNIKKVNETMVYNQCIGLLNWMLEEKK